MNITLKFSDNHRIDNNSLQQLQASEIVSADLLYLLFVGLTVKNIQQGMLLGVRVVMFTECTTWCLAVCIHTGEQ